MNSRKLIATSLLAGVVLTGCNEVGTEAYVINSAIKHCETRGGLSRIFTRDDKPNPSSRAICLDGTEIIGLEKRVTVRTELEERIKGE